MWSTDEKQQRNALLVLSEKQLAEIDRTSRDCDQ
jgi:hypothetical protein